MTKYIFVTGGVVSGLGKGITAASLGRLLKMRGYKVASQKLDPYINIDPGTMSPYQHGEVFVTEDGAETDLDLGHYERFIDENLNKFSNLTTGKVYWNVLNKERAGEYLGQTVQVIPHITNEIKSFIYQVGKTTNADIVITEIGGTTGDIESQPFIEAIRQVSREVGRDNCCFIHVTLVPYISGSCEFKSKPTQHSVKELQGMGISPDIIVARVDEPMPEDIREKIAMFCNVKPECCIENLTLPVLYEAPMMLEKSNLSSIVCGILHLEPREIDLTEWEQMLDRIHARSKTVKIALCGKYVQLHDAYLSIAEALAHGGYETGAKVDIDWVDTEALTPENVEERLKDADGILIPGGFGGRYSTFVVQINGKPVISNSSISLPSGSKIKVTGFSDYSLEVVAAEPQEDFEVTVGEDTLLYSDLAGEDMTSGFTFTESEDGAITINYGSIDTILAAALGEEVTASDEANGELFTLVITSGNSTLSLNFILAGFDNVYDIITDPDHIIC